MTVWAEQPKDGGSAVWGCDRCSRGGWCSDHTSAFLEARMHADDHRDKVTVIGEPARGPRPDHDRDARIRRLRTQGHSLRAIAEKVGCSPFGVRAALRRTETRS